MQTRPELGLWWPEFSPSGTEHSSVGYRSGVCFMQTPTLLHSYIPNSSGPEILPVTAEAAATAGEAR